MNTLRKRLMKKAEERGQGMTEYIIIVALIAILSIGIISLFGTQIRDWFGAGTKQLSGEEDATVTNRSDQVDDKVEKGIDDLVE